MHTIKWLSANCLFVFWIAGIFPLVPQRHGLCEILVRQAAPTQTTVIKCPSLFCRRAVIIIDICRHLESVWVFFSETTALFFVCCFSPETVAPFFVCCFSPETVAPFFALVCALGMYLSNKPICILSHHERSDCNCSTRQASCVRTDCSGMFHACSIWWCGWAGMQFSWLNIRSSMPLM